MNRALTHRFLARYNLITLMGICLCMYFTYHALHGQRSYLHLMSLNKTIERTSEDVKTVKNERAYLEQRVAMLRPGSIDTDLLEERSRLVLGYQRRDEITVLQN